MIIILAGGIGRSATGGQAWANLQYLLGLRDLGHDVYYLEDCGEWSVVYDWEKQEKTWELDYPANYIQRALEPFGLGEKWIYRAGDSSKGLRIDDFCEICSEADLLVIRGIPFLSWRKEYDLPSRRAYVDVDPGFTQLCYARGEKAFINTIDKSESLYSFGQRIGDEECLIPTLEKIWHKTVPPVMLNYWPEPSRVGEAAAFTTIVRWQGMKNLKYNGVEYGQRDKEFAKYIDLPRNTRQTFNIAIIGGGFRQLQLHGWNPIEGWSVTSTPEAFKEFIQSSRAEFGIAKNMYVDTRSGWISDRSACYLASGRPILVQDTGVKRWFQRDSGALTFSSVEEAVLGIDEINRNYAAHSKHARKFAVESLGTKHVLPKFLEIALN